MKLSNEQFKSIINNLPAIEINLDWNGDEGTAEVEGHEVTVATFQIFIDLAARQSITINEGDFSTPPSIEDMSTIVEVLKVDLFTEGMNEEIVLKQEQEEAIFKAISNNTVLS